jgi:hypothetical protein
VTLTTTGSNTLNRLVTITFSAVTISATAGTGSWARSGSDPCPPSPCTSIVMWLAPAIRVPGRVAKTPRGPGTT